MRTESLVLLAAAAVGCSQPYVTPERLDRGLVIVLPGIEGRGHFNEAIADGLNDANVDCAIEIHDWTAPMGPVFNLRAEQRNRGKAAELAERIAHYVVSHPDRPVVLVGQSGGGAMAAWTAEALPYGYRIDGVIMLAPALSPGYLLDRTLASSRRGVVNFYSHKDWAALGLGTTILGTMDGEHGSSAGRVGFDVPGARTGGQAYGRLFQVAWTEAVAASGNYGGHLTSGARGFVARYVAPFVRSHRWNAELVARVLRGEAGEPGSAPPVLEWAPLPPGGYGPTTQPAQPAQGDAVGAGS